MALIDWLGDGGGGGFGDFTSPGYFPRNQGFDTGFPLESFRQDAFGSAMAPQDFPVMSQYLQALQNRPTYEENKPGLGRTIGAALAGLAASFNSPAAGAAVAGSIANAPYTKAMQDYGVQLEGLGRGAQMEQGLAQLNRQIQQDAFDRFKFGETAALDRAKLAQAGELGRGGLNIQEQEVTLKSKVLENQMEQQRLDRALAEKKIGIDQYQAATARLNAETNVAEAASRNKYYEGLINAKQEGPTPNAAMLELQFGTAIQSDPLLNQRKFYTEGKFDPRKVMQDPTAAARFQALAHQLGLLK